MCSVKSLLASAASDNLTVKENVLQCISKIQEEAYKLDMSDVDNLITILTNHPTEKTFNLLADLAKTEENRSFLTKNELLKKVLECLTDSDQLTTVQALRCLCNICAQNAEGGNLFSTVDGVKLLYNKASYVVGDKTSDWSAVMLPACMCVQNIISANESLLEDFLSQGFLTLLWKIVLQYEEHEDIVRACVTGIAQLAETDAGVSILKDTGTLRDILYHMKTCVDTIKSAILTELISEFAKKENTAKLLCECGCVLILMKIIESRDNFQQEECLDVLLKEMVDVVVLLTSGEDSFSTLQQKDGELLNMFIAWIQSKNKHVQVSAGLSLGNYARSDATCNDVIQKGIHKIFISQINLHVDDVDYEDRLQAFASCLRNLCIPVETKGILIDAGLAESATNLVKRTGLMVQFKGLGILRLLVQGNASLAVQLCNDVELLNKITELSEVTVVSTTPSEAQRLIAAIVKYANEEACIRVALTCKCLSALNFLLGSDHVLMQNEGLIALIMVLANVNDCVDLLKEFDCLGFVAKLLRSEGIQPQTLFNGLTLIQASTSLTGGLDLLKSHDINLLLESLKNHSEDIIKNKVIETIDVIGS